MFMIQSNPHCDHIEATSRMPIIGKMYPAIHEFCRLELKPDVATYFLVHLVDTATGLFWQTFFLCHSVHSLFVLRLPTAAPPPIVGRSESHRYCRHSQGKWNFVLPKTNFRSNQFRSGGSSSRSNKAHLDSGKSSDSSLSSTHGYRRLQDGGSLRIGSQQRNKHGPDNSYVEGIWLKIPQC